MYDLPPWTVRFYLLLLILLLPCAVGARAQPPLYRIGAPYPPVRDPNLMTDNGIPGTGSYYYRDYPYPSLREALQEYGLFGHRFQPRAAAPAATPTPSSAALIRVHLPADAELRLGGQVTSQRGAWRRFVTPPLPSGPALGYEVEACWNERGREIRQSRTVRVEPGSEVVVDFLTGGGDSSILPPPRPLPPP